MDGQNGSVSDDDDVGKPSKKKNKKRKKHKPNKEGLQQKKKSKHHAIQGQFDGMEMPSFSGLSLTDNMNFSTDPVKAEENGEKKSKKKKKKVKDTSD